MTIKRAKTIQIFLPSGDPLGIREAQITTDLMRVMEIPRTAEHLSEYYDMPESQGSAVYFLVESESEEAKRRVYIGQTTDVKKRFGKHLGEKSFWHKALVAQSRAESLSSAHIIYLERMCIERAKAAGRFAVHNGNDGQKALPTKQLRAECEDLFETIQLLLATLGHDLFSPKVSPTEPIYRCTMAGTDALAQYSTEGMTVLKGSKARLQVTPSFEGKSFFQTRAKLIQNGILTEQDGHLVFTEDYTFGSPSSAASITVGNNANGWTVWKTDDGKTLDEVIRKALGAPPAPAD